MSGDNGTEEKGIDSNGPLMIIDMRDGNFSVQGPGNGALFDEPMCLFLLEKGKDYIKAHNIKEGRKRVVPSSGGIVNFARNKFRGGHGKS